MSVCWHGSYGHFGWHKFMHRKIGLLFFRRKPSIWKTPSYVHPAKSFTVCFQIWTHVCWMIILAHAKQDVSWKSDCDFSWRCRSFWWSSTSTTTRPLSPTPRSASTSVRCDYHDVSHLCPPTSHNVLRVRFAWRCPQQDNWTRKNSFHTRTHKTQIVNSDTRAPVFALSTAEFMLDSGSSQGHSWFHLIRQRQSTVRAACKERRTKSDTDIFSVVYGKNSHKHWQHNMGKFIFSFPHLFDKKSPTWNFKSTVRGTAIVSVCCLAWRCSDCLVLIFRGQVSHEPYIFVAEFLTGLSKWIWCRRKVYSPQQM